MRYMITIHNNDATLAAIEGADREEFERVHREVQEELHAAGEFVDSHELSDLDARVVRRRADEQIVTNGPLRSGDDWPGGYYVIECADIDRAVRIAGRFVEARYAPIEVRRVVLD